MKMENLEALYIEQLQDLYSAEQQLVKGLEQMIGACQNEELKQAFETHLKETHGQIERLEGVISGLGQKPEGKTCKAMEGLIKEAQSMLKEDAIPEVLDAGLIAMAQRIEHYEIAGYGTVATYAQMMGRDDDHSVLSGILAEEKKTDELLTQIAESVVNVEALAGERGSMSVGTSMGSSGTGMGSSTTDDDITMNAAKRSAYTDTPFYTGETEDPNGEIPPETQHAAKSAAYKDGKRPF